MTGGLEIASLPSADSVFNDVVIDSIVFSPSQIPEPSLISLMVIGAAMAGWRLAIRRREC